MAQSKENTNVSARGKAAAANQNAGAPAAQTGALASAACG